MQEQQKRTNCCDRIARATKHKKKNGIFLGDDDGDDAEGGGVELWFIVCFRIVMQCNAMKSQRPDGVEIGVNVNVNVNGDVDRFRQFRR